MTTMERKKRVLTDIIELMDEQTPQPGRKLRVQKEIAEITEEAKLDGLLMMYSKSIVPMCMRSMMGG